MNLENCPRNKNIPIYLVVTGVFIMMLLVYLHYKQKLESSFFCSFAWKVVVFIFLFWFVLGKKMQIKPISMIRHFIKPNKSNAI